MQRTTSPVGGIFNDDPIIQLIPNSPPCTFYQFFGDESISSFRTFNAPHTTAIMTVSILYIFIYNLLANNMYAI